MDMFSPILPIRPLRTSSTVGAEAVLRQRQRRQRGHVGRVAVGHQLAQALVKARNESFLDTKSVSQLTSIRAPVLPFTTRRSRLRR
jgi:hypothetical protein